MSGGVGAASALERGLSFVSGCTTGFSLSPRGRPCPVSGGVGAASALDRGLSLVSGRKTGFSLSPPWALVSGRKTGFSLSPVGARERVYDRLQPVPPVGVCARCPAAWEPPLLKSLFHFEQRPTCCGFTHNDE